jgi:RHS repeat-associated protein
VLNATALVQGWAYAYGDGMNLTGITDQLAAANNNVLGYSPANRLSAASGAWGNASYAYDLVGNRTSEVVTLGATTTTTTATIPATSNRVSSMARNGAAFRTYTYDNAGNIITDARGATTLSYTYNKRNRLASVSASLGTYQYNALEQMISRVSNAAGAPTTIVHYIYDLDGHLIAEANGSATSNTFTREYIWLPANDNNNLQPSGLSRGDTLAEDVLGAANDNRPPDLPLAAINVAATPVINFVHTDHLGRPTRMTSAAKATVWSAVYKPWGEVQSVTGTAAQNLRSPGQYFLIETGLAYNWHRHYDPATGRYTQPDPLGLAAGANRYAYSGNSPWMRTDRMGLFDEGNAAGGNHQGHSDFTGGGAFDYNKQDTDPKTEPIKHPKSHFLDLPEAQGFIDSGLNRCDKDAFERAMHMGQDYFVHYKKGFRWWKGGHARPGFTPGPTYRLPGVPGTYGEIQIPIPDNGHRFDNDPVAWILAEQWSANQMSKWYSKCSCRK